MATQQTIEDRLWDYIDGASPVNEKTTIEKLLETNLEWRSKYHELLEVHQLIQSTELESPSMRFGKNVMDEIARIHIAPATKTYINKKIIRGITFFFIVLIVGFLVYGFGQVDWNVNSETAISENISENLSKINFNKFFSNTWVNVFMMINVVLGLFLLDNYLSSKRKEFRKG